MECLRALQALEREKQARLDTGELPHVGVLHIYGYPKVHIPFSVVFFFFCFFIGSTSLWVNTVFFLLNLYWLFRPM